MDVIYVFLLTALVGSGRIVGQAATGEVRLVGGDGSYGRVEVFYAGRWGTVCDDEWGKEDAAVVCRQLGFPEVISANMGAFYGQGAGDIWLDDVKCAGSEDRLDMCERSSWGNHNCNHGEDAGVACVRNNSLTFNEIRVSGGGDSYGRVEILYDGEWGTICDDGWGLEDARVVCRQLGFTAATAAVGNAHYGEGDGMIWLDDVRCGGYENHLSYCSHSGWGHHNCQHQEDASVECTTQTGTPHEIRLADGTASYGRVEIYYDGQWGTVCHHGWDLLDAQVVCRQLGFSSAIRAVTDAYYGEGNGQIWLDNVNCYGDEENLSSCQHNPWGIHNCAHDGDAGVECFGDDEGDYTEGEVRLVTNTFNTVPEYEFSGTVVVYHLGEWGTVCDDYWDIADAQVVCRQLGFPGASSALTNAYYGPGPGAIVMDDVRCSGNEYKLTDCWHNNIHDCSHSEDAGVQCQVPHSHYPRLADGMAQNEGRVEIWNNYRWERVCESTFESEQADAVCKELGLQWCSQTYYDGRYDSESMSPPTDVGFHCNHGDRLSSCYTYSLPDDIECGSVGIRCFGQAPSPMSAGAVVGIVLAVLFGIVAISAFVAVALQGKKASRNRQAPTVATISGVGSPPSNPTTPHQGNMQVPLSYNDVVDNPSYYPTQGKRNPAYPPHPVQGYPYYETGTVGYNPSHTVST